MQNIWPSILAATFDVSMHSSEVLTGNTLLQAREKVQLTEDAKV